MGGALWRSELLTVNQGTIIFYNGYKLCLYLFKKKITFWNFLLLLKVQRGRLWDLRLFENVMQFLSQAHRKNLITFCWKLCYTAISHIFFYYCHFFVTIFLWYSTKLSIIHVLHKKSFFHIWANIFWMVSLSRS